MNKQKLRMNICGLSRLGSVQSEHKATHTTSEAIVYIRI